MGAPLNLRSMYSPGSFLAMWKLVFEKYIKIEIWHHETLGGELVITGSIDTNLLQRLTPCFSLDSKQSM